MSFSVIVTARDGQFTASLAGVPRLTVVAATRPQAIEALKVKIAQRVNVGELVTLEVASGGITDLAGSYSDDPTLRDICDEAYQVRDNEKPS